MSERYNLSRVLFAGLTSMTFGITSCNYLRYLSDTSPDIPVSTPFSEATLPPFIVSSPLSFESIDDDHIGINFCTSGRDVGTTLRVFIYNTPVQEDVDIETLEDTNWSQIKELGVSCFNTNMSNLDWPILDTSNLVNGALYLIKAEARPSEANGAWDNPSVQTDYAIFNKPSA